MMHVLFPLTVLWNNHWPDSSSAVPDKSLVAYPGCRNNNTNWTELINWNQKWLIWKAKASRLCLLYQNGKESSLAGLKILWFYLRSLLLDLTPDMLNNVHVWWLGWPILDLPGRWSMRRTTILLKNLPSLVVWNVMGSKNFLILPALDVAIHSAGLSHTPMLDLTPYHDFSSTKLDCVLGESWVHAGSNRSSAVFAAIGMQFSG